MGGEVAVRLSTSGILKNPEARQDELRQDQKNAWFKRAADDEGEGHGMKYTQPAKRTSREILDTLSRSDVAPSERIEAVLSAIFFGETTEFSGDVLIKEFSEAQYKEKSHLTNIFETFYQMRETDYRIDESIILLKAHMKNHPEEDKKIEEVIGGLSEYKIIFKKT